MFRHLREDTVSGTPTGERARSGGSAPADLNRGAPRTRWCGQSHLRLPAFRFLPLLFVLSSLQAARSGRPDDKLRDAIRRGGAANSTRAIVCAAAPGCLVAVAPRKAAESPLLFDI